MSDSNINISKGIQAAKDVKTQVQQKWNENEQLIINVKDETGKKVSEVFDKSKDLYNQGEDKLQYVQEKAVQLEEKFEEKWEDGEQKIKQHSKKLRFLAAVFFFPIWFSFYNLIHTTLATWDIFIAVYRKIDPHETGKKIIYTLFMCCFGCGIMQIILFVMSIFHVNCEKFKEEQSLQVAFREVAYEPQCYTAMKIEQSLLVFFGNYMPVEQNDNQLVELQQMNSQQQKSNNDQELTQNLIENNNQK